MRAQARGGDTSPSLRVRGLPGGACVCSLGRSFHACCCLARRPVRRGRRRGGATGRPAAGPSTWAPPASSTPRFRRWCRCGTTPTASATRPRRRWRSWLWSRWTTLVWDAVRHLIDTGDPPPSCSRHLPSSPHMRTNHTKRSPGMRTNETKRTNRWQWVTPRMNHCGCDITSVATPSPDLPSDIAAARARAGAFIYFSITGGGHH